MCFMYMYNHTYTRSKVEIPTKWTRSIFDFHIDSDMYSFDVDEENAMETYKEVCLAYERIFKRLDLPAVKG